MTTKKAVTHNPRQLAGYVQKNNKMIKTNLHYSDTTSNYIKKVITVN